MLEIVQAGGWLMLPIIACSIAAAAIILERLWTLQNNRVAPKELSAQVSHWAGQRTVSAENLQKLHESSPLGQLLAAGLASRHADTETIKQSVEDCGRHVVHELERYLNPLGTIAAITPLLGLLGTVIGMIKVFAAITANGVGNPGVLAGGISEALITTAAGLSVAIPALIGYRYLRGRIDSLVVHMEKEVMRFIDSLAAQRVADVAPLGSKDETANPRKRSA
jgi:biopolymer transport protein ExbB